MRAWAYGLRSTDIAHIPGSATSATKVPRPLTRTRFGRPGTLRPTDFTATVLPSVPSSLAVHRLRRCLDRLDDELVAGAAAEVAGDAVPDLLLAGLGVVLQQLERRQHHPGRAVAALQALVLDEGLLHRVQLVSPRADPFDRRDLLPVDVGGEDAARLHRLAVQHHGARTAASRSAPDVRPRQPQHIPQHVGEDHAGVHLDAVGLVVHGHLDWSLHGSVLSAQRVRPAAARIARTAYTCAIARR